MASIPKNCIICERPFEKRRNVTRSRKDKKGRGINCLTCSPKCARDYERIRKHFEYNLKLIKLQKFLEGFKKAQGFVDFNFLLFLENLQKRLNIKDIQDEKLRRLIIDLKMQPKVVRRK